MMQRRYDDVVTAISAKEVQSERRANFIKVQKTRDRIISLYPINLILF